VALCSVDYRGYPTGVANICGGAFPSFHPKLGHAKIEVIHNRCALVDIDQHVERRFEAKW